MQTAAYLAICGNLVPLNINIQAGPYFKYRNRETRQGDIEQDLCLPNAGY
jgi:hypothetical protein